MIKAIIVDDEQNGREILDILIKKYCKDVFVCAIVATIKEAIYAIKKHNPELIFLDIELEGGTGFDVLSHSEIKEKQFNVIFTTAYEQYAIEAIKNNAIDYLLKPIDVEELKKSILKVSNSDKFNYKNFTEDLKRSFMRSNKLKLVSRTGFQLVNIQSIIYCKSEVNYTRFYFENGKSILTSKTLKTYQKHLENNDFLRIHRSHIINLNKVQEFLQSKVGQVVMSNKHRLDVSPTIKPILIKRFDLI